MISQYLIKKAATPLNEEDTDMSLRHYFLPAQLAALQGLSPKQQRQANWDAMKLTAGGAGSSALLGLLGYALGSYFSNGGAFGKLVGSTAGALAGLPLGTFLTHKLIQHNRNLGDEYGPSLSNLYGLITPKAALSLQGVSKQDQKQVTKDMVKLLGGKYLGRSLAGNDRKQLGGLAGNLMTYKSLKDDRMRTQQYNDMQQQLQQLKELQAKQQNGV